MIVFPYQQIFQSQEPLKLRLGGSLPQFHIAYETWGTLNANADNALLLFTGLSASAHAKSHDRTDVPGWWEAIIGDGISIEKFFVVCFNPLGGCFGSTGPSSLNPETGIPYGPDFPPLLMEDIVHAAHRVVQHLGIRRVAAVVGASMGGMQAMEYAASYPDTVDKLISISASGRPGPQSIAFRFVQRQVILHDAHYAGGWYYDKPEKPIAAMAVARQIGNITYRSRAEFNERFGRARAEKGYQLGPDFQVEAYLHHMGWKLGGHYDPNSFLLLSKAMDLFSLGHDFPTYERGAERIRAKSLIIGVTTDMLFPLDEQESIYQTLVSAGRDCQFEVLESNAGHDAFLVDVDFFNKHLWNFLHPVGGGS